MKHTCILIATKLILKSKCHPPTMSASSLLDLVGGTLQISKKIASVVYILR